MFKSKVLCIPLIISAAYASAQNYDVSGTDYNRDKLSTQTWVEDASNIYIEMAKSFACVIADSRPEVNPNTTWIANIDESKCGLSDIQGKSVASAILTSSRASNSTPQEVSAWFTASNGYKYLVSVTLRQSVADLPPYGSWDFSYYLAQHPDLPGTTFTASTSPSKGWVTIGPEGTDVVVKSWDQYSEAGGYRENIRGKFVYIDGSLENTKFIGREESTDDTDQGAGQVGRTNATAYFLAAARFESDDIKAGTGSATCFSRGESWKSSYRASLYDHSDGSKISLSGAFPFTSANTEAIATRGWYDKWGAWIENDSARLSPLGSMSIVNDDTDAAYTLLWSGGRLENAMGKQVSRSATFANAANPIPMTCTSDCFVSNGAHALPYEHTAFASGNANALGSSQKYLFTPVDVVGYEPLTLYHDVNGNDSLDAGDKPVRWDFSSTYSQEAEYQSYSSPTTNGYTFYDGVGTSNDGKGNYINDWPYRRMGLSYAGNTYWWSFEPFPWSPVHAARDANGDIYVMDDPISANITYDFSRDDMNASISSLTIYNQDGANNTIISDGDSDCSATPGNGCTIATAAGWLNTSLDFEYDGSTVRPYKIRSEKTIVGQNEEWLELINPATGTILTDTSDTSKKYVVLQDEVGEFFIPDADLSRCTAASLDFTSLADPTLNLSLDDVPVESDFSFPTITWADRPADASATCEVTEGVLGQGC